MFRTLTASAVLLAAGIVYAGGSAVELDVFKSKTPDGWKTQQPDNKFRAYQFSVPKADGDAKDGELVIFFFGAGSGGSADDNIKRWKKMFIPDGNKSIDDVSKVETFKVGNKIDITYLDVAGTYVTRFPPFDPNAKEVRHADHRMLGVVFSSENGPYFIRLTGAAKTVAANKKAFDDWIKAFK